MSGVTIAELNGRVWATLPMVEEYCQIDDVHRAIVGKLNVWTSFARSGSDKKVLLSTTANFTPTTTPYDITALLAGSQPAWIETRNGDSLTDPFYPIRVVPLSQISNYYELGELACAFWAEDTASKNDDQATQYVSFTFPPSQPCRIRFDMSGVKDTIAQIAALPEHIVDLVVKEAENALIKKKIQPGLAIDLRRDEDLRKDAPMILKTLDGFYQQNLLDIKPLLRLWEIWAFRSPDTQTSFQKPTPSMRGMYGD